MKAQRLFSELTLLHKHGIDNVVFADFAYAAELLAQASEMGNTLSAYRLSKCYKYGKMAGTLRSLLGESTFPNVLTITYLPLVRRAVLWTLHSPFTTM